MHDPRARATPAVVAPSTVPDPLFIRAAYGERVERTPTWIMRQAGRYLPEYRAIRERYDFLTTCHTPELACEITLQPVERLAVDAAILFSDILVPLPGMGVEVTFSPGPRLAAPIRSSDAVRRLRVPDPEEWTPYVLDAIRLLRRALPAHVPLIGFAGAPFTIATYLVEGGGSKSFSAIKQMMFATPDTALALLDVCTSTTEAYAAAQVQAGAQALMLFDTWASLLSPADYVRFAQPFVRRVLDTVARTAEEVDRRVPRIYYAGNAAGFLDRCRDLRADVIGVDWRMDLSEVRRRLGSDVAVQGNLDPTVLLGTPGVIRDRARQVLASAREGGPYSADEPLVASRGHIFNLGHGILPETPPDHARLLVDTVRECSAQRI